MAQHTGNVPISVGCWDDPTVHDLLGALGSGLGSAALFPLLPLLAVRAHSSAVPAVPDDTFPCLSPGDHKPLRSIERSL